MRAAVPQKQKELDLRSALSHRWPAAQHRHSGGREARGSARPHRLARSLTAGRTLTHADQTDYSGLDGGRDSRPSPKDGLKSRPGALSGRGRGLGCGAGCLLAKKELRLRLAAVLPSTRPSRHLAAPLRREAPCAWSVSPRKDRLWPGNRPREPLQAEGRRRSRSGVGGRPRDRAGPAALAAVHGPAGRPASPARACGAPTIAAKCWPPSGPRSLPRADAAVGGSPPHGASPRGRPPAVRPAAPQGPGRSGVDLRGRSPRERRGR